MAYSPENNPYIPGDPYSYDLKWIVAEVKKAVELYTPLSGEFDELYNYVHDYFKTSDFEALVDNGLRVLAADGTLAQILQPMFDLYKVDINSQIAYINSRVDSYTNQIAELDARMDEFTQLAQGSTTGDAELIDIRAAFDGETYNTAGAAVRGQINDVINFMRAGIDVETQTTHTLLTRTSPASVYGNFLETDFLWIMSANPIPARSIAKLEVLNTAIADSSFKLCLLRKNSDTSYTIIDTYDHPNTGLEVVTYWIKTTDEARYIGLYSNSRGITYATNSTDPRDALVRATLPDFISGGGTANVVAASGRLNFSYGLTYTNALARSSSSSIVIVDQNGGGQYETINDAINGTQDGDTIVVMPGLYLEKIRLWGQNRAIIGIDREHTIIAATERTYGDEPIQMNKGYLKNVTVIAGYGQSPIDNETQACAYAIHIEHSEDTSHELIVEDCHIISNVAPAIGAGVRYNQSVIFNNCTLETKAKTMWSAVYSELFNIGAIFVHNDASGESLGGQGRLIINNCELKGVIAAATIQSQETNNPLVIRFTRDLLWSTTNGKTNTIVARPEPAGSGKLSGNDVTLAVISYGNNVDIVNA